MMGIYSRDYLRDDDSRFGWRDFDAVKWLIIANVAVFVVQVVWQDHRHGPFGEPVINGWLALDRSAIFGGQFWRLLTYEFLHAHDGPGHLFFNMLLLYFAGRKVESYYGPREFLLFYLTAGILSGIFTVFWYEIMGPTGWSAIGASGAVASVFILYALHWPHDVWRLFFVLPVQVMWLAIFYAAYDVFPMLQQIGQRLAEPAGGVEFTDGVARSAHVGGMLFALAYQRFDCRVAQVIGRLRLADLQRKVRPRTRLRLYEPESAADLEARVDELLAKVAEHGESSLTDAERAELIAASRRYRNRQR